MILKYDSFQKYLNDKLFQDSYSDLIRKIAENPERYIGLFRPTKPKTKLIQNITQSHEIRFGDALEFIFEQYFKACGYRLHQKKIKASDNTELNIDQLFSIDDKLYMIEQKVRDDHDSTKKVGQFDNFKKKYESLITLYPKYKIIPIMWFIDDSLKKNKRFYESKMLLMNQQYNNCLPKLYYGSQMFSVPDGITDFNEEIWTETFSHLTRWKQELKDMSEINFDKNADIVFEEIKNLPLKVFEKIIDNLDVRSQIFPILFPENIVPEMLINYFYSKKDNRYTKLADALLVKI